MKKFFYSVDIVSKKHHLKSFWSRRSDLDVIFTIPWDTLEFLLTGQYLNI